MLATLREHGVVRLFGTSLRGELGSTSEVEISGTAMLDGGAALATITAAVVVVLIVLGAYAYVHFQARPPQVANPPVTDAAGQDERARPVEQGKIYPPGIHPKTADGTPVGLDGFGQPFFDFAEQVKHIPVQAIRGPDRQVGKAMDFADRRWQVW